MVENFKFPFSNQTTEGLLGSVPWGCSSHAQYVSAIDIFLYQQENGKNTGGIEGNDTKSYGGGWWGKKQMSEKGKEEKKGYKFSMKLS